MIPYGRQHIDETDIEAVVDVLRSDFLTQGPQIGNFEAAFAARVGAVNGIASNSATSSLHLAYLALGVGPGDIVWTSPVTFVATANAAVMCGASVDFVDIDADTFCMDVVDLERRLAEAQKTGQLPKVVAPVHLTGRSCDMKAIAALADQYGFRVVEDAAHAVGADYDGKPVGACVYSDIAVFSFHPVKIITTAEGGMATTNDPELANRMRILGSHGITRDPAEMVGDSDGSWYYQQISLGFNYRMTDIQAALGLSQLKRLDAYLARRRELVRQYTPLLAGFPVATPDVSVVDQSAWHLYVIRVSSDTASRGDVFEALRAKGIGVQVHYIPVHLQPFYQRMGFKAGDYPVAESYYSQAISLPMFPTLTDAEQEQVAATLGEILRVNHTR